MLTVYGAHEESLENQPQYPSSRHGDQNRHQNRRDLQMPLRCEQPTARRAKTCGSEDGCRDECTGRDEDAVTKI